MLQNARLVGDIKRAERLISLTQQSGWDDLLKILDTMWINAHDVIMSAPLHNGGIERVIEARAIMTIITNLINSINSQIAYGEKMKEKMKPNIKR